MSDGLVVVVSLVLTWFIGWTQGRAYGTRYTIRILKGEDDDEN